MRTAPPATPMVATWRTSARASGPVTTDSAIVLPSGDHAGSDPRMPTGCRSLDVSVVT